MFNRILGGLSKTSSTIFSKIGSILGGSSTGPRKVFNEEDFKLLESALLSSDVGNNTTQLLLQRMKTQVTNIEKELELNPNMTDIKPMKSILREEMLKLFQNPMQQQIVKRLQQNQGTAEQEISVSLIPISVKSRPTVVQICGVNGSGKTTSIGKLLHKYRQSGTVRHMIVAAADTVRAAAPDQLRSWVERTPDCSIVDLTESEKLKKQSESATHQPVKTKNIRQVSYKVPAESVVYEAIQQGLRKEDVDVVFVDTAGRLQNQEASMKELALINEMCSRSRKGAPDHTWLVLDGTIGQNSIQQAKLFQKYVRISGIIVTKLDGSAKGGVILAIANELKIPVLYIGLGESVQDLRPFYPEQFVDSILSVTEQTKEKPQDEEEE
ncbi:hypothetical protein C9374_014496 [Naegleria lovaniensis]|uniref:SRP54-type proteins GTP-binding domain-containing protein n=1 Tax=Naegleria lovaniensis TaxID=51637 RepID=A0AA88KPX8_NAELO|nr:uncharacterized protein C9374_014496 [Naegleria lovaniensis]KAG2389096.1 hypothetical protein C9374_014496 [Naegleria lovaniensis]